eukprot:6184585-Pleurochrysis_carterae.AAC.3
MGRLLCSKDACSHYSPLLRHAQWPQGYIHYARITSLRPASARHACEHNQAPWGCLNTKKGDLRVCGEDCWYAVVCLKPFGKLLFNQLCVMAAEA